MGEHTWLCGVLKKTEAKDQKLCHQWVVLLNLNPTLWRQRKADLESEAGLQKEFYIAGTTQRNPILGRKSQHITFHARGSPTPALQSVNSQAVEAPPCCLPPMPAT